MLPAHLLSKRTYSLSSVKNTVIPGSPDGAYCQASGPSAVTEGSTWERVVEECGTFPFCPIFKLPSFGRWMLSSLLGRINHWLQFKTFQSWLGTVMEQRLEFVQRSKVSFRKYSQVWSKSIVRGEEKEICLNIACWTEARALCRIFFGFVPSKEEERKLCVKNKSWSLKSWSIKLSKKK